MVYKCDNHGMVDIHHLEKWAIHVCLCKLISYIYLGAQISICSKCYFSPSITIIGGENTNTFEGLKVNRFIFKLQMEAIRKVIVSITIYLLYDRL